MNPDNSKMDMPPKIIPPKSPLKPGTSRGPAWTIYFLIYAAMIVRQTSAFFVPGSTTYLYYDILMAYDIHFLVLLCLNGLSVLLNILSLVPLYGFIYRRVFLSEYFWRMYFIVKVVLDITGRSYESLEIKSLFFQDTKTAWIIISHMVILYLPAYAGMFLYAFFRKNLLKK